VLPFLAFTLRAHGSSTLMAPQFLVSCVYVCVCVRLCTLVLGEGSLLFAVTVLTEPLIPSVCHIRLYHGLTNKQVCRAVIKLGVVLPKPTGCPAAIYDVMVQCWRKLPQDRPSFGEILKQLERIPH
jgi:hypothetical protein